MIKIILTGMLSKIIKGIAIIASANNKMESLCFRVMALSLTKSSKYFLYSFVPLNQTSNFLDPFTKQKAANRNNGVVGKTGKTIPIIPNPRDKNPHNIKTALTIVFIIIISFS